MTDQALIRPIRQTRFDALTYARMPMVNRVIEPEEWFADGEEIILGVVGRDNTEIWDAWVYITLGRDETGLFRTIDLGFDFEDIDDAREALHSNMVSHVVSGEKVFIQDKKARLKKKNEIYRLQVKPERQHEYFVLLTEQKAYSPAKEIIQELVYAFGDPDGNYIKDFQSDNFNARLWELYLFAYLREDDFELPREHVAPDFTCVKDDSTVFIEAVTVNPTTNAPEEPAPQTVEEIEEKLRDYMPVKFGSPLTSKLAKRYWEKPHVQGRPLVFAIQDFHQHQSLLWSYSAIWMYLYGVRYTWRKDGDGNLIIIPEHVSQHVYKKPIPSGFFNLPDADNVSAVLFGNAGTISKFNRMGKLADFGDPTIMMWRKGVYRDPDPNATEPIPFSYEVDADTYEEPWSDGLTMFHNPNAKYPVDPELFPSIEHLFFEDGQISSHSPLLFYPYWSVTYIFTTKQ